MSDSGCDYKTRAGMMYSLQVEKGDVSNHGCNYKNNGRDNILAGGRDGATRQTAVVTAK
jgi:hypothetical protein